MQSEYYGEIVVTSGEPPVFIEAVQRINIPRKPLCLLDNMTFSNQVSSWYQEIGGAQALIYNQFRVHNRMPVLAYETLLALNTDESSASFVPFIWVSQEGKRTMFVVGQYNLGLSHCDVVTGSGRFQEQDRKETTVSSGDVVLKFGTTLIKTTVNVNHLVKLPSIGKFAQGKTLYDVFLPDKALFEQLKRDQQLFISIYEINGNNISCNHAILTNAYPEFRYKRFIKGSAIKPVTEFTLRWLEAVLPIVKEAVFNPVNRPHYKHLLIPRDQKRSTYFALLCILALLLLTVIIAFELTAFVIGWQVSLGMLKDLPVWGVCGIISGIGYGWYLVYLKGLYMQAWNLEFSPEYHPLFSDQIGTETKEAEIQMQEISSVDHHQPLLNTIEF